MSGPTKCGDGRHIFPTPWGKLERGTICICGRFSAQFEHAGTKTRWYAVPGGDALGMSGYFEEVKP